MSASVFAKDVCLSTKQIIPHLTITLTCPTQRKLSTWPSKLVVPSFHTPQNNCCSPPELIYGACIGAAQVAASLAAS